MMKYITVSLVVLLLYRGMNHARGFLIPRPTSIVTASRAASIRNRRHGVATRLSMQPLQPFPLQNATQPTSTNSILPSLAERVCSVNYFISRQCNYACQFCFHTAKSATALSAADAQRGLDLLAAAGTCKINFAGGEPFVRPHLLGTLCRYAHQRHGMAVSIISNGSLITEEWMRQYGYYVDVLGVSIDSFHADTNARIGRGGDAKNDHVQRILRVRQWCAEHNIQFKANTVVFLVLEGENAGGPTDLRDARNLTVTDEQYQAFVERHQPHFAESVLIPESNAVMQNSYLLLDENLCFLDCSAGGKVPSESILDVGVERALSQAGFDYDMFQQRGGIFEWTRPRQEKRGDEMLP